MKIFLAITFALAAIFNTPTACAHAFGIAPVVAAEHGAADHAAATDSAEMASSAMHASHHQNTEHPPAAPADNHHDCNSDCDGGNGCDGCALGAMAVLAQDRDAARAVPAMAIADAGKTPGAGPYTAEPPPPRAL